MEDNTNAEFNMLTAELQLDKLYQDLLSRAEVVARVAQLAAGVYKVARKRGLPRKVAGGMAMRYFSYELAPEETVIYVDGEE
ncbi:hypothetical protein [Streptomyces sp. NBC_01500]|uniref:hypothetical protein n=1 Tax=Streptomyces sp. NBC_01500 TaxID=2903886 RepID=UPI00224F6024|nr:hypothetical protein [Streptomyces sp. NBC_01500]MCX4554103.1 hypothetical protein [Streptomyces sp. NBC_01500]